MGGVNGRLNVILIIFLLLSFIIVGCAINMPRRMLTGTAGGEDSTTSTVFVELIPTPGEVFTTIKSGTLTALFVGECRISSIGQRLEIRIRVDDQIADPGPAVLTMGQHYETRSHLGFKTNVPAGTHKVAVEWRVSGGRGFVRNRSFTVWEVR
jgi:hypothetical protein